MGGVLNGCMEIDDWHQKLMWNWKKPINFSRKIRQVHKKTRGIQNKIAKKRTIMNIFLYLQYTYKICQ